MATMFFQRVESLRYRLTQLEDVRKLTLAILSSLPEDVRLKVSATSVVVSSRTLLKMRRPGPATFGHLLHKFDGETFIATVQHYAVCRCEAPGFCYKCNPPAAFFTHLHSVSCHRPEILHDVAWDAYQSLPESHRAKVVENVADVLA